MKILRVKGVRRTGNNFLLYTLRHNLDVVVDAGGSAHRLIKEPKPEHTVHFIITIKNPYSWCISITNWARSSWGSEWSKASWDNDWVMWEKLYKGYNKFYRNVIEFLASYNVSSFIINYEDFLRSTEDKLKFICDGCDVGFKNEEIIIPKKVKQSDSFSCARKKFYLDGDGRFGLNNETIEKINACVDWKLMSRYGYEELK